MTHRLAGDDASRSRCIASATATGRPTTAGRTASSPSPTGCCKRTPTTRRSGSFAGTLRFASWSGRRARRRSSAGRFDGRPRASTIRRARPRSSGRPRSASRPTGRIRCRRGSATAIVHGEPQHHPRRSRAALPLVQLVDSARRLVPDRLAGRRCHRAAQRRATPTLESERSVSGRSSTTAPTRCWRSRANGIDHARQRRGGARVRLHASTRPDVVGIAGDRLLSSPEHRRCEPRVHGSGDAATPSTLESPRCARDGTTVPVLATLIPIVFRGAITGVHLLARDLTAIRRAEREVAAQSGPAARALPGRRVGQLDRRRTQIAATIDAGCRLLGMTVGSALRRRRPTAASRPSANRCRAAWRGSRSATDGALAIDDLRGVPYLAERGVRRAAAVRLHRDGDRGRRARATARCASPQTTPRARAVHRRATAIWCS